MVVSQIKGSKMQRPINKHNGSERYYDKLWEIIRSDHDLWPRTIRLSHGECLAVLLDSF